HASSSSTPTLPTPLSTLSLHDALPIFRPDVYHQLLVERNAGRVRVRLDGLVVIESDYPPGPARVGLWSHAPAAFDGITLTAHFRSEEHTSELQSRENLVCRLLLEKKK